jgi:hypothetical protein
LAARTGANRSGGIAPSRAVAGFPDYGKHRVNSAANSDRLSRRSADFADLHAGIEEARTKSAHPGQISEQRRANQRRADFKVILEFSR